MFGDNVICEITPAINNDEAYWLGIRTQVHTDDRKFYYLTEGPEKSTIKNWSPGEPNDVSGEEDCVSVLRFDGAGLGWADTECDMSAFSICEVNEDGKRSFLNFFTLLYKCVKLT